MNRPHSPQTSHLPAAPVALATAFLTLYVGGALPLLQYAFLALTLALLLAGACRAVIHAKRRAPNMLTHLIFSLFTLTLLLTFYVQTAYPDKLLSLLWQMLAAVQLGLLLWSATRRLPGDLRAVLATIPCLLSWSAGAFALKMYVQPLLWIGLVWLILSLLAAGREVFRSGAGEAWALLAMPLIGLSVIVPLLESRAGAALQPVLLGLALVQLLVTLPGMWRAKKGDPRVGLYAVASAAMCWALRLQEGNFLLLLSGLGAGGTAAAAALQIIGYILFFFASVSLVKSLLDFAIFYILSLKK